MRVKDTLNLGKTKFKMRGNLPVKEVERQKQWAENNVYQKRQELNKGKPSFILHDGPPYANGDIHMGHALNKISKDIILRYKSMNGYYAPYVPGWDTHGLPIEEKLTSAGYDRKKMSTNEFRELCRKYALKEVQRQKGGFKRLGVSGDWDNPYLTLQPEFEAEEVKVFGKMAERGLIYRGKKPVIWSWSSESALAEAEVEYHDITSPTAFYGERVLDGKGVLDNDTYMVVWTTTPWTIPASEGITLDANFDYSVIQPEGEDRKFVIATDLVEKVTETLGWENYETKKVVKGKDLEYVTAQHPFDSNRKILTMLGDFVTTDAGTGLVHTAPGFGDDDYNVGKQYGLDIFVDVDDKGYMTKEAGPDFDGVFYDDANEISLNKLKESNLLLLHQPMKHSYPFDWRTKKPVIYRATPQWFASVDKIKDELLDAVEDVQFKPSWGKKRLHNMLANRGDWVISRQRVWGVPLPIFYAEDGTPIIEKETVDHVAELFKQYGSNIWFEKEANELLPDGYTNEHSPHGKFTKENDIMDVWFDSGSSHQGVLAARDDQRYPADLYLEGSDQYRGWFNSSIITSVAYANKAPYKQLLSQGFTLDAKGHKMSKSLGNTIAPNDVIKKMGAEIVRLWVSSVDSSADIKTSMGGFAEVADRYKKIRNTVRYMLSNTSDFDPKENTVSYDQMYSVDKFMLMRLNSFINDVKSYYDDYDFLDVYKELLRFVNSDLSAFYLNMAKDVLYIDAKDSDRRRSMQTVLYQVLVSLTKLMTPILPHTAEEVWPFLKENEDFVQLSEMPSVENYDDDKSFYDEWNSFMNNIREDVLKALEEARDDKLIGKPSEAKLELYVDDNNQKLLDALNTDVQQVLLVSQLNVRPISEAPDDAHSFNDGLAIKVDEAEGTPCRRCRLVKTDVGKDPEYPDFCARCAKIVRDNFPETVESGFDD